MAFEWNQNKSDATKADPARGFDFAFASRAWDDPDGIDFPARSTTEPRAARIAKIDGKLYAVFYTLRGTNIRIISARRARPNEEKLYG